MRIVFLAVDDEFAGAMQGEMYRRRPEWIVGSVLSRHSIFKKNLVQATWFIIRQSGLLFFLEMFRMKILRKIFGKKKVATPRELAMHHDVPIFVSTNINDAESLEQLAAWKPDLIISTNFSHYIGARARASGRLATWNLHRALLPQYRGMAPNFHALREGAGTVGVTLHVVEKGFDTGAILAQQPIDVVPGDSVYSLNCRSSEEGGRMLAEFLESYAHSPAKPTPQPDGDWKTYTYPSAAEVREFRAKGLKF